MQLVCTSYVYKRVFYVYKMYRKKKGEAYNALLYSLSYQVSNMRKEKGLKDMFVCVEWCLVCDMECRFCRVVPIT